MTEGPTWKPPEITVPKMKVPLGVVRAVVIVIVLAAAAFSAYYQVEPDEEAVILRFGKYVGTAGPGPHLKIPFADTVYKVPVQRQLKMEFGFRTLRAGVKTVYSREDYTAESQMLTGDLNVADVEWIVQFKIRDPYKFLFKVRNVQETFRDLSEAVMREVVGDHSVDEVLTIGREKIAAEAQQMLQDLCDRYETGIAVEQLVLQDVNPPDPVKPAFNEVNQAIQERERLINDAWAEYNKAIPREQGEAERRIRMAEGYALERVNNAKGEASRFLAVVKEYRRAPQVTRRRLYLEAIGKVLPKVGRKAIVDEKLKNVLPLLNLGQEPAVTKVPAGGAK